MNKLMVIGGLLAMLKLSGCGGSLATGKIVDDQTSWLQLAKFKLVSEDTGPIPASTIELFKELGFTGVFRVGIEGSKQFEGEVELSQRAQRMDTLEWSQKKQVKLKVTATTGEAVNLPSEKVSLPSFLIKHELVLTFPSGGSCNVNVARGGASMRLEPVPTEIFSLGIGFANPNETKADLKQSQFELSWTKSVLDEATGELKQVKARATVDREPRDQLWLHVKRETIQVYANLFSPRLERDEPDVELTNVTTLIVKQVDPGLKEPKPIGTFVAERSS